MDKTVELVMRMEAQGFNLVDRAKYHEQLTKGLSFDAYIQQQRLDLNRRLKSLNKIYLDTKYWILFREVVREHQDDSQIVNLFNNVKSLVEKGKAICPISTVNFTELFKQNDPESRLFMARVMDLLSRGYTIRFFFERIIDEFYLFLKRHTGGDISNIIFNSYDPIAHCLGFSILNMSQNVSGISPESFKKASYDMGSYIRLEDMVNMNFIKSDNADTYDDSTLTNLMNEHKGQLMELSFSQIFDREIGELVYGYRNSLAEALKRVICDHRGYDWSQTSKIEVSEKDILNYIKIIDYCFKNDKLQGDLSLIDIQARVNSFILSQSGRKFKDNDFNDFRHASVALNICDYFFTENSLKHLLTTPPTNLAQKYKASVLSKHKEALEVIKML